MAAMPPKSAGKPSKAAKRLAKRDFFAGLGLITREEAAAIIDTRKRMRNMRDRARAAVLAPRASGG